MFLFSHLLTELSEAHRTRLLEEAEQHRLLCVCRPERPGWSQVFFSRLGDSLISTGEWLKERNQ